MPPINDLECPWGDKSPWTSVVCLWQGQLSSPGYMEEFPVKQCTHRSLELAGHPSSFTSSTCPEDLACLRKRHSCLQSLQSSSEASRTFLPW